MHQYELDFTLPIFPYLSLCNYQHLADHLGFTYKSDLQICGAQDESDDQSCWVLNKLIELNELVSRGRFQLVEEHACEVTLCSWNTVSYNSESLSHQLVLFLLVCHPCIAHLNLGHVSQKMMKEILSAISKRSNIRSFSISKVMWTGATCGLGWGKRASPCGVEQSILNVVDNSHLLSKFEMNEDKMWPSDAEKLGLVLSRKTSLKKLSLRNEYAIRVYLENCNRHPQGAVNVEHICFTNCNSDSMMQLAEILMKNTTISYLDLSGTMWLSFGCSHDDGVIAIAKALHSNQSVRTLILVNINIGPRGLKALAAMIIENKTLKCLDVSQNHIPPEECMCFADAARTTKTLKVLRLHDCRICFEGVRNLLLGLKENRSGLSMDFGNHWSIDCTPFEVLDLIIEEKVERVPFNWTAGTMKKIGHIPEWCRKVSISLANDNLRADRLSELKQYLEKASARVSTLHVRCSEGSEQVCLRLANLLSRPGTIEELDFECKPVHVNVLKDFAEAAATSSGLRKLRFGMFTRHGLGRPVGIVKSIPLAETLKKSKTLEIVECDLIFNRQALRELSDHIQDNYALTELRFCVRNENYDVVRKRHHIGRRNAVLQQQALHFVVHNTNERRWAAAFSLTHDTATLRRKVEETVGMSTEDAECLIRAKWFTLCINFFKITRIVKERVVCNELSPGVVQIDRLDLPLLAHVASFLKVHDVKM